MPRINREITVTAGTPVNAFTGGVAAVAIEEPTLIVGQLFIQSRAGNTGLGYVMAGVPRGTVASKDNADHLTAELAASPDAVNPGGAIGMSPPVVLNGDDITTVWVDGSHTGDKFIVSYMR